MKFQPRLYLELIAFRTEAARVEFSAWYLVIFYYTKDLVGLSDKFTTEKSAVFFDKHSFEIIFRFFRIKFMIGLDSL